MSLKESPVFDLDDVGPLLRADELISTFNDEYDSWSAKSSNFHVPVGMFSKEMISEALVDLQPMINEIKEIFPDQRWCHRASELEKWFRGIQ